MTSGTLVLRSYFARVLLPMWLCMSLAAVAAMFDGAVDTSVATSDSVGAFTGSTATRDPVDHRHARVDATLESEPEPESEDASHNAHAAVLRVSHHPAPWAPRHRMDVTGGRGWHQNPSLGTSLARGPPLAA